MGSMRRMQPPPHMVADWGTRDPGIDGLIVEYQDSHS